MAPSLDRPAQQRAPRLKRLRGEALAGLRRLGEAESDLQESIRLAADLGAAGALWRARAALARVYRLQRRWGDSERELAAARSALEALANNVAEEPLRRSFLQNAQAQVPASRPPSAARRVKGQFGGLTTREREVARLIARGKSNRAIAQELTLSERTVTTHVANILAKLGFSSRVEIAAWAVRSGLARPSD